MKSEIFLWDGFSLPSWQVFHAAASLAAFFCLTFVARNYRPPFNPRSVRIFFLWIYLGMIAGSMAWAWRIESADFSSDHFPMSSCGGILGGIIGGVIAAWQVGIPAIRLGDLCIGPVLLGMAIGRIGCFLNGDDFGIEVSRPLWFLGVSFPALADGIVRHPVQLYEALTCALGCVMILRLQSRDLGVVPSGRTAGIGLVWYAFTRGSIEFLRADWRGPVIRAWQVPFGISIPQVVMLLLMMVGVWLLARSGRSYE